MGEYAIRSSDGAEIKIGTCENMYYLRFEDREKVQKLSGNVDPIADCGELRFRLPFPDEDDVQPGEYEDFNRGQRLYRQRGVGVSGYCEDWKDESTVEDPGIMQLRHEASGLLLNVPCYHGVKLPDVIKPMQAFWNGKGHAFELAQLRPIGSGLLVYPVVRCRFCQHAWRYDWSQVWDYIPYEMQLRLRQYREAFVEESA
jgi:hypothetical protein